MIGFPRIFGRPPRRGWRRGGSPTLLLLLTVFMMARKGVGQYVPREGWSRRRSHGFGFDGRGFEGDKRGDSQSSTSTEAWLISHTDFCVYGPPDPFQYIDATGLQVVSWCSKSGHNTRLIPDGTLHGVTYVKTNDYVQVSGNGDFTKINIAPGDEGGQFDSNQNTPSGAKMYTTSDNQEASSWVTLISSETFCVRACTGDSKYCPTDYDEMGCWFFTGNAVGWDGVWQDCQSDDGDPPGVISGTTYSQGDSTTPTPTAPSLSACSTGSSVANGQSAPPLYSWGGSGTAVPLSGGVTPTGSGSGGDSTSSDSGESTSWVAVQTCTPCSGGSSTASSSSGSVSGGTTQVGVTQISTSGGVQLDLDISTSSQSSTPTSVSKSLNDFIGRDGTSTTTSNGQCCFTTWTPSIISGGGSTTAGGSGSKTASGSLTSVTSKGSSSVSGSVALTGTSAAKSGAGSASVSGSSKASGSLSSGNGTNGTNLNGGAIEGISKGGWRVLVGGLVAVFGGLVVGGWSVI